MKRKGKRGGEEVRPSWHGDRLESVSSLKERKFSPLEGREEEGSASLPPRGDLPFFQKEGKSTKARVEIGKEIDDLERKISFGRIFILIISLSNLSFIKMIVKFFESID